jgi:hypothetical protein
MRSIAFRSQQFFEYAYEVFLASSGKFSDLRNIRFLKLVNVVLNESF